MPISRCGFVSIWICAAAVVVLARAFNAADPGYELPIQVEAARHLLAGKGLTIHALGGEDDLAAPARLLAMRHFPAGFSLYAAALLGIGLTIPTIVKIFFGVVTILGWWGWGRLAFAFCQDGIERGGLWKWTAAWLGLSIPLLFTPAWQGTDLFVWAAVPWVLFWLTLGPVDPSRIGSRSQTSNAERRTPNIEWQQINGPRKHDLFAGLLCGVVVFMRYSGVLLVIYAALLIVAQSHRQLGTVLSRSAAFVAGLLPILAAQFYFTLAKIPAENIPDVFAVQPGIGEAFRRIGEAVWTFPAANWSFAWWWPPRLVDLITQPGWDCRSLLVATILGWAILLPLFAVRLGDSNDETGSRDVRTAALGLFVAFPLLLCLWSGFADYNYVRDQKYYLPLLPLAVLIAYAAGAPNERRNSVIHRLARAAGIIYLGAFIGLSAVSIARLPLPGNAGLSSRLKLLGTSTWNVHWPSNKLTGEFSPARAYTMDLLKQDPAAILVTNHEEWFYADPAVDQSRVRRLKDFQPAYVTGPAHIIIAIQQYAAGSPGSVSWYGHYGTLMRGDYFQSLPGLTVVQEFPDEQIKILESRIPEGERVVLNRNATEVKPASR
ncbi:MAG TPA: hypothetical protein VJ719_05905 [Chthoniobacterales bacterium]|nr:hypothetical protein [Chthoniobacterales bacterium]